MNNTGCPNHNKLYENQYILTCFVSQSGSYLLALLKVVPPRLSGRLDMTPNAYF